MKINIFKLLALKKQKNQIIIITGPSGVGKTTISKKLSQALDNSVYISLDTLRSFVKNGYQSPATFKQTAAVIKQSSLARNCALFIAKAYYKNGFNIIVDDVLYKKSFVFWTKKLKNYNFKIIVLKEELKTIIKRNTLKKTGRLDEEIIIYLKKQFDELGPNKDLYFIKNENTDKTVKSIKKIIAT